MRCSPPRCARPAIASSVSAPAPSASRARAAELLPGVPVLEPHEVARASNLVILALPDDVLGDPAGPVLDLIACGALHARQVVAHTSGRHGLNVLGSGGPRRRDHPRGSPGADLRRHRG